MVYIYIITFTISNGIASLKTMSINVHNEGYYKVYQWSAPANSKGHNNKNSDIGAKLV